MAFEISNDVTLDELNIPHGEDIKTVTIYHSKLRSKISLIYDHDFVVISTGEEYFNTTLWWSVEKNNEEILVQHSHSKDDVSKYCFGNERSSVSGGNQFYDGKRTIGDLFKFTAITIAKSPYNVLTDNCRDFAKQTFNFFTQEGMDIWDFRNYCLYFIYSVIFVLYKTDYQEISMLLGVLIGTYVIIEI